MEKFDFNITRYNSSSWFLLCGVLQNNIDNNNKVFLNFMYLHTCMHSICICSVITGGNVTAKQSQGHFNFSGAILNWGRFRRGPFLPVTVYQNVIEVRRHQDQNLIRVTVTVYSTTANDYF